MAYRRQSRWNNDYYASKVQVLISWDNVTNSAYKLRFDKIGNHWDKVKAIIEIIKGSIPYSQREYDADTKTWYIGEKFIQSIKSCCEAIPDFEVTFAEKPAEVFASQMHSTEEDLNEFKRLLSFAHIDFDTSINDPSLATKVYRKAAMYMHPDRNPNMADEMSKLNAIWARLKEKHFKIGVPQSATS